MFDDNHMEESDLLMRSILENAQEEVPAHVWDGVAEGLDRAARRRTMVLWFGRAASVAAAAAIAVGLFFRDGADETLVPTAQDDMIAVVEQVPAEGPEEVLMANVEGHQKVQATDIAGRDAVCDETYIQESASEVQEAEKEASPAATVIKTDEQKQDIVRNEAQTYTEDVIWEDEDEERKNKIRTSLVISGIAGTNNPQNSGSIGPFKSPGIFKSPEKTTIEQTSAQTIYGIPVSFGAGVKLRFSERWSLGMGLNYSMLTSRFNGKYTKVEDGKAELPLTATIRNTQHYVGIPINAYYSILSHDHVNFYAYAGGTVEKCVADKYIVQTTPVINHAEAVKGVQLSANAGIGVEFSLGRYVGLYIDPSLRYYFHCGQPKSIRTAQPLMLGFEMGLRFNL
jgi:hypothetical protein